MVKGGGPAPYVKLTGYIHVVPMSTMVELHFRFLTRLYGVVTYYTQGQFYLD
jgi:hypothetical protein